MKTEEIILNNLELNYPLEKLANLEEILFLDIETTGFLSSSSSIYIIGCAYFSEGNWIIKQFFANDPDEEKSVLEAFFDFAKNYSFLIHFNGNTFDLPFINAKAQKYDLINPLLQLEGLDIYKRISCYRNMLKLPDCKLKTIEMYLGLDREDQYTGGELISVYSDYMNSHDFELYHILMLHNSDDMKGMLLVLPILAYYDLFNEPLKANKVSLNQYKDISGIPRKELVIGFSIPEVLPVGFTFMGNGCHFMGEGQNGTLVIPIHEEEMKYFYSNYKDYYYLPLEDTALHKSIASFVDKDYREQAKASNCYTRKIGEFLPMWDNFREPFFKRNYESKDLFFELTEEIKTDRDFFSEYAALVLKNMINLK